MEYRDFIVRIGPGTAGSYPVEVASPAGEGRGSFEIPAGLKPSAEAESGPVRESLRDVVVPSGSRSLDACEAGSRLFRALFAGEVSSLFHASLSGLQGEGLGLRIRLVLDLRNPDLIALQDLPWELLYRPETREFLGLSRRTPIVRTLHAHRQHRPPIPASSGLRILVVGANPSGSIPLQLERELRHLEAAWKRRKRKVRIVFLRRGGREELRRAFLEAPAHILHFMGHGRFDEPSGEGTLLLEEASGAVQSVGGGELAGEVKDFLALRLVVLNACQTARTGTADPFAGLAAAQVVSGVPAVIAMRRPIPDHAAVAFSRTLYDRLAAGDPIEAAMAEARLAVHRLPGRTADWATPVLFLRGPDGRLFAPVEAPRRSGLRWAVLSVALVLVLLLALGWTHDRRKASALQHNHQALALMSDGRNDEARREFLSALDADPGNGAAHANLSLLEERLGHYDEALNHARAAVAAEPGTASHYYNLGNLLERLGRDDEALESLHRAVELDFRHAAAWNELGRVYLRLDRPAEARQALTAGLRADPGLAPLYKNLALADLAEGNAGAAISRLEKALSLYGPDDPQGRAETLYHLAEAQNRAGRRELACRQLADLAQEPAGPWMEAAGNLALQIRCGDGP